MSKLNEDVLFLILEELQDDRKSLYSCLLVNRTWCETTVPILWKDPYPFSTDAKNFSLFNVILLHLSEESRDILKNHEIDLFTETYHQPLFNYIIFWRHLNLHILKIFEELEFNASIIRNEILKLFINRDTRFTHLYIPKQFNYQIHLISGAEHCFSELEFLHCDNSIDQDILEGLAGICKSIKTLELYGLYNNPAGIVKLIEAQKNLNDISFNTSYRSMRNESYCKTLEESLIKNADTVKFLKIDWKPITNILSYLVNLISLDINWDLASNAGCWSHLESVSLPVIKILRARQVPSKILASLIENTKGNLIEINIFSTYYGDLGDLDKIRLIQAIYKNCPNLKYLKQLFSNDNFSELEKLLINCQYLNLLFIITDALNESDWDDLFEILTKFSPTGLFDFGFSSIASLKLESLNLFFDNWKGRHPMVLKMLRPTYNYSNTEIDKYSDLFDTYKVKGVIEEYSYIDLC